jgi:uncharacterized protein YbcI
MRNLRVAPRTTNIFAIRGYLGKLGDRNIGFYILLNNDLSGVIFTNDIDTKKKLDDRERKHLQHELKVYMEQYFKQKLGKGVDYTKIVIWDDMLIIRGEGFLTDPEKYIVATPTGKDLVNSARMQVAKQHSIDNLPYLETILGATAIHQTYMIEAENDFWMHVVVFDKILTE